MAGLAQFLDQYLRGSGMPMLGLAGRFTGVAGLGVVAWVASKTWGIMGIAWAYVTSQAVCLCVLIFSAVAYYDGAQYSALWPRVRDLRDLWDSGLGWLRGSK